MGSGRAFPSLSLSASSALAPKPFPTHTTQHNTTQHNTTQHNTTQHNTTQHNTTQHNTTQHPPTGSVNSVSWAPHQWGLALACASSDGRISVLTYQEDGTWDSQLIQAHSIGCNAVSWAPSAVPSSMLAATLPATGAGGANPAVDVRRFVSGGCDNLIKVWVAAPETGGWREEAVLSGHTDWVRDVAWAPNVGLPTSYIASCSQVGLCGWVAGWLGLRSPSPFNAWCREVHPFHPEPPHTHTPCTQDKTVMIWSRAANASTWSSKRLGKPFPDVVWRVSWSMAGNLLAVSCGDNQVSLWKETLAGDWTQVSGGEPSAPGQHA